MADTLKLHFQKPGLLTTVQDAGRFGYQHVGIPMNGAMDKQSARQANELVGNAPTDPVLEITLMGPTITVEGSGFMAITGANLSPTCNGEAIEMYAFFELNEGDEIRFGRPQSGCRAYLAIGGHWQVQPWLESVSASAVQPDELTPQSLIKKGSVIEIVANNSLPEHSIAPEDFHDLSDLGIIRILPGPEFSQLSNLSVASFFSQEFTISNDSNRMGYRLNGTVRAFEPQQEVISSGIIPGTIQITNSGQPIVLMADAQTSGGYFRLGNVISSDLDLLAQMKPSEKVRFVLAE